MLNVDGKPSSDGEYLKNMLYSGRFGVPVSYEIKDGHLVATLSGSSFEATVFEQKGKHFAARSSEFGYMNYEPCQAWRANSWRRRIPRFCQSGYQKPGQSKFACTGHDQEIRSMESALYQQQGKDPYSSHMPRYAQH